MQMSVAREGGVAPDAVDGDADDLGAVLAEFRKDLVVESNLVAAPDSSLPDRKRG
jgi:hypothetical protein